MYEVRKTMTIDSAHHLPYHKGECKNLHGHTWKVEVIIRAERLNKEGMIMDFGEIKRIVNMLDHTSMNEFIDNPTAENIAKYIYDEITGEESFDRDSKVHVNVWETPSASVAYYKDKWEG